MTKISHNQSSSHSVHQHSPPEYCQISYHSICPSLDAHPTPHTLPPSSSLLDYSHTRDLPPGMVGICLIRLLGLRPSYPKQDMQTEPAGSIIPLHHSVWLPPFPYIPAPPSSLLIQTSQPLSQPKRSRSLEGSEAQKFRSPSSEVRVPRCAFRSPSSLRFLNATLLTEPMRARQKGMT